MNAQTNLQPSTRYEPAPDDLHVPLFGRLDTAQCAAIGDSLLKDIRDTGKPVVFDLDHVDFVSSAFLRICILAAQVVGAGHVSLRNASPSIKRVFKIAGLDGYILVE